MHVDNLIKKMSQLKRSIKRKTKSETDKAPNDFEVASWADGYEEGADFIIERLKKLIKEE